MHNLLNEKIETERLFLLPISMKNKESIFNDFNSDITTYMYPKPADTIEETISFIETSLKWLKEWSNLQMVVYHKDDDEFLGCAWLHNVDKDTPEFGIWIKKNSHGNWYGREAIIAIKEWADKNMKYEYILYPVDESNKSSRKIAEILWGKIEKEYEEESLWWRKLKILEYRIYPEKNQ